MRIVVKIGSSSLVDHKGELKTDVLDSVVEDVAELSLTEGLDAVIVTSGAIATGLSVLKHGGRPRELPALQAASAVGQGQLFAKWARAFSKKSMIAAQVLMTMHDVSHRTAYLNARNTLEQLLEWDVVPVVNENDTTATDEITFGDNDALAAQVAVLVHAEILVLLTDTDGLYTAHPDTPDAELIEVVDDLSLLSRVDTARAGSHWGSGGMRSKVVAAGMASGGGVATHIANAREPHIIRRILSGERLGTTFVPDEQSTSAYKLWLRYAKRSTGTLHIDDGAKRALTEMGASLLPVGIASIEGAFQAGDAVTIVDAAGGEIAKGLVEYSSRELVDLVNDRERARGAQEAVHRDDMVLLSAAPVH